MEYLGRNSIEQLAPLLQGREAVVFTRESIYRRHEPILAPHLALAASTRLYSHINPNPSREEVRLAQSALRGGKAQVVVAFGGGSVIDFAKAWRYYEGCCAPMIAIPTTAGTGSEATQFAVIYMDGVKTSLDAPELLPEIAIVDSQFVEHSPQYLKACCAMDAYCQAIESYWAKGATPESRRYALDAVALCREHLVAGVNTAAPAANEQLARAAYLAGRAINISRTTAAHALSYKMTSDYGIPHGHAVALSISGLFQVNLPSISEPERLLQAMGISAEQVAPYFAHLMRELRLETSLPKLGITDPAIIVDSVNTQRLGNNPKTLSREELLSVLMA